LFDVAHKNVLVDPKVLEEDKEFLIAQRERGRRGYMAKEDLALARIEERIMKRKISAAAFREREQKNLVTPSPQKLSLDLDTSNAADSSDDDYEPPKKKENSSKQQVVTPALAALMDRLKLSVRQAATLATAFAAVLGIDVAVCSTSPTIIHRMRCNLREMLGEKIKAEFYPKGRLIVHWDGKQLRDLTGVRKVDRLPILVSGGGKEHVLAVAKLSTGTGASQTIATAEALREWKIEKRIAGGCFDTTFSNTGEFRGTCTLLSEELEVDLLQFACRHHIDEIILGAVVERCLGSTKGPKVTLFVRFREFWDTCNKSKFDVCPVNLIPASERRAICDFCWDQIKVRQWQSDVYFLSRKKNIFVNLFLSNNI